MQTYTHYKESGIDWIGQIPEHWELAPNKFIFNLKKNQVGKRSSEYDLLSLTLRGIIKRDMENPEGKFPAEFDTYQEVKINDFVFCLFDVEETPRTVGLSNYDGMITGAYTVMEPIGENFAAFLYYYYLNADDKKQLKFLYRGLRNTIPKDSFFSLKTALPPIQEQKAIANFLDDKTAKIDALVQTKEQQIEKLKELRQAKIHQAVTKGLDANAPTKNSGVEWIGEIPENWGVKRLKNFSSVVLGKMLCNEDKGNYDYKPYLKSKNIQWLNVNIDSVENMWFSKYEQDIFRLKKGDLILSEGGEVGKVCIWNDELAECYIQNSAHKVTVNSNNSSKYHLYSLFTAGKLGLFDSIVNKVSIGHLTREKLINIFLPIPPIQEQEQIVAYLDEVTGKIDQAIAQKQEQITKLKEYKQSLINNVVTGKVKVC